MEIEITARNDRVPDRAKQYAREKLARVEKFFDRVGRVHISLEVGKDISKAHAVAHLDTGSTIVADTQHGELRAAIDLLSDKLERQVRREKERLIARNRRGPGESPADAGGSDEEPTYDDVIRDKLEED